MATLQDHLHHLCILLIFIENTAHIALKMSGIFGRNHCGVMHLEFLSAVFVSVDKYLRTGGNKLLSSGSHPKDVRERLNQRTIAMILNSSSQGLFLMQQETTATRSTFVQAIGTSVWPFLF